MKYCKECGEKLPDTAKYCVKCGEKLPEMQIEIQAESEEQKIDDKPYIYKDPNGRFLR